jgi:hypothetical protein
LEKATPSPKTKLDRENLVWQMHFVNTKFFIRARKWYELSLGDCRYLDGKDRCTVYERRPDVCRNHNPPECERYGDIFDVMFDTPEDLLAHFQKTRDKKNGKRKPKRVGKKRRGP